MQLKEQNMVPGWPSPASNSIRRGSQQQPIEKVVTRQEFLCDLLAVLKRYQRSRSPGVLNRHMSKNREMFTKCVDMLSDQSRGRMQNNDRVKRSRSNWQQEDTVKSHSHEKITACLKNQEAQENDELQKQYQEQLEIAKGNNSRMSKLREKNTQQQMMNSIYRADAQLEKLKHENKVLSQKVQKMMFYREWKIMQKELEGATTLNLHLQKQLGRRKEILSAASNDK